MEQPPQQTWEQAKPSLRSPVKRTVWVLAEGFGANRPRRLAGLFEGRQHPSQGHEAFGVFADASPDRWGRLLMRRRLERAQRAGRMGKAVRLHESGYLLGVHAHTFQFFMTGQLWRVRGCCNRDVHHGNPRLLYRQ